MDEIEQAWVKCLKDNFTDDIIIPQRQHIRVQREYLGHYGKIQDLSFNDDSSHFASIALDGKLIVWDVLTRFKKRSIKLETSFIHSVAWCGGGSIISVGGYDNMITLYDVDLNKTPFDAKQNVVPLGILSGHTGYISSIEFGSGASTCGGGGGSSGSSSGGSSGSSVMYSGSGDGSIKIWDLTTLTCVSTLYHSSSSSSSGGGGSDVLCICSGSSSDGGSVFVSGGSDGVIILHDIRTPTTTTTTSFIGSTGEINCIEFLGGSGSSSSGSSGGSGSSSSSSISGGSGRCIVSGGGDGCIRIWDSRGGTTSSGSSSGSSGNGSSGSDGSRNKGLLQTISYNGSSSSSNILGLDRSSSINSISSSSSGRYIFAGCDDGNLLQYDLLTLGSIATGDTPTPSTVLTCSSSVGSVGSGAVQSISSVTVSSSGGCLLSAGDDGIVKMWA